LGAPFACGFLLIKKPRTERGFWFSSHSYQLLLPPAQDRPTIWVWVQWIFTLAWTALFIIGRKYTISGCLRQEVKAEIPPAATESHLPKIHFQY
jgi:hypothetical protein